MNAKLATLVSEPRFGKYLKHSRNDAELAADLYEFNLRLAGGAFKAIQMCEVIVRNAMDQQLRAWNQTAVGTEDWTLHPAPMLKACFYDDGRDLTDAASKASKALRKSGRTVGHDDVLAQMSFGAWRYLPPGRKPHMAKQRIWDEALTHAFPGRQDRTTTDTLAQWLGITYDFRNRVAHHEPIYHLDVAAKRRVISDVIDAVSRDAKKWFIKNDEFGAQAQEFQRFVKERRLRIS
ncbi:Abi family protein [Curtobacterium sp. VKM Ac-1393]|uniref:Abi family protein n=1 Tax=Curtobacterium sp. VKM Ac-1393 TaxID=2783814 RepID=UPI00188BB0A8|nr:Abi family protein [Curtobacterium sp. VKM Ac-1393]MBF4607543.1 Abi family protein [Curtobacterium sp. VKM Ac-1393]